jgi:hypothetical protein
MGGAWRTDPNAGTIREFLRLLAVCHTVIPEGEPTPSGIKYQVRRVKASIPASVHGGTGDYYLDFHLS